MTSRWELLGRNGPDSQNPFTFSLISSTFSLRHLYQFFIFLFNSNNPGRNVFLVSFLEGDGTLHSMPCPDQCSWFGKARLEVDFDGEAAAPTESTPSEPAPHPRRRRRRRARGAAKLSLPHQLLLEVMLGNLFDPRRPLKHHRPASDGLHTVLTVGRPAMLSFASLNMDGSSTSLPPRPPPPPHGP